MAEKTQTPSIADNTRAGGQLALFPSEVTERVNHLRANPIPGDFTPEHLHSIHRAIYDGLTSDSRAPRGTNRAPDANARNEPAAARAVEVARSERAVLDEFRGNTNLRTASRDVAADAAARLTDGLVTTASFNAGTETAAALMVEQAMRHNGWRVNMFRDDGTVIQPQLELSAQNRLTTLRNQIRPEATPLRAIDFQRAMKGEITRAEAEANHPELRGAFENVDWARLGKEADNPQIQRTVSRIQRDLGNGTIPKEPVRVQNTQVDTHVLANQYDKSWQLSI